MASKELTIIKKFLDGSADGKEKWLLDKAIEITTASARGGHGRPDVVLSNVLRVMGSGESLD